MTATTTTTLTTKNDKNQSSQARKKKARKNKKRKIHETAAGVTNHNHKVKEENDDDDLLFLAQAWASSNTATTASTSTGTSAASPMSPSSNGSKKKNKKKSKNSQQQEPQAPHQNKSPSTVTVTAARGDDKPPRFPAHLAVPTQGFLRNLSPYQESFQRALETCHEGLVWEMAEPDHHVQTTRALQTLHQAGLFRTDVTQPAGLGAKLVPSYVTRCLVGDPGTTYRYLGLRMFAHCWNPNDSKSSATASTTLGSKALTQALQTMRLLNTYLSERATCHLETLRQQRQERNSGMNMPLVPAKFNVTLINRMTVHKRLREEPMFRTNKYSVGWHADSSLEHYSTIAVYHAIVKDHDHDHDHATSSSSLLSNKKQRQASSSSKNNNHHHRHQEEEEWSVATRVTHNAEGPRAKRLGDITVEPTDPAIAVSLPSGSTYFMLDDYNHHHQHAVLAPTTTNNNNNNNSTATVRYSSTHRLLRKGHTVQEMLLKCRLKLGQKNDNSNNHHMSQLLPHGPKRWRGEQVLLTELENEWLRQFYIQGSTHKNLLWGYWQTPITELFACWQQLEERTLAVMTLLRNAAWHVCGKQTNDNDNAKAAAAIVTQMVQSSGGKKTHHKPTATDLVYHPMAALVLERAKARELWAKREKDPVFQKMPSDCRPIHFPVVYGISHSSKGHNGDDIMASSPLPEGSPTFLTLLARQIEAWGLAFDTKDAKHLPKDDLLHLSS